jgi:hypothetical protein
MQTATIVVKESGAPCPGKFNSYSFINSIYYMLSGVHFHYQVVSGLEIFE